MKVFHVLSYRVFIGFFSGVLATIPMSLWMLLANRTIPTSQPDPLPPEEITKNLIQKTPVQAPLSHSQTKKASVLNHFLYGGTIAIPFSFLDDSPKSQQAIKRGFIYGLLVWAGNYCGLLPLLNLYPPASKEPARMNGLMIIAHIVWGIMVGYFINKAASTLRLS